MCSSSISHFDVYHCGQPVMHIVMIILIEKLENFSNVSWLRVKMSHSPTFVSVMSSFGVATGKISHNYDSFFNITFSSVSSRLDLPLPPIDDDTFPNNSEIPSSLWLSQRLSRLMVNLCGFVNEGMLPLVAGQFIIFSSPPQLSPVKPFHSVRGNFVIGVSWLSCLTSDCPPN